MLIERRPTRISDALQASLPPLLARLYGARNITDPTELELSAGRLLPPGDLLGLSQAVELLCQMLEQQGRVLVVSDFDVDGATSCAVVIRALSQMGFQHLDYIVPDRFTYGYGLSPEIVDLAVERHPDLIITVDNGISSIDGVDRARLAGIKVLITDHHLPPEDLPAADAIVNPNQRDCEFASKALAGVGVAFYLMLALRARLRETGWFEKNGLAEPRLADLLDLVALGTVADVVALDQNNRILVHEGLRRIRAGHACAGILALLELSGRNRSNLQASDLGFAVAPRLNAAGRLEDMSLGIACLLTDDPDSARRVARQLDTINTERKRIEADMREQALQTMNDLQAEMLSGQAALPAALCLYNPDWHQGVAGILASRVKEQFHRPVIIFANAGADADGNGELKGSARSIPGLHIRDLLDSVASRHPGLISKFGGHAMAAGLSLPESNLSAFIEAFQQAAAGQLDDAALQQKVLSDGELDIDAFSLQTAELLRQAGPWGQGFPAPLFDGEFSLIDQRLVGGFHLKMIVSPDGGQTMLDAIAFNIDSNVWPDPSKRKVTLVYRLDVNEFRGQQQLQLLVEHLL
ncbi:single-stranded-DNA-specific exonuclease RecJ [Pseudohongiella spirulinae]|uniref:Single-stranded-DNA-specific exonuclease RecJ n=1 Tax=Pseudohongiella spirulinae TaxID=1249552 RepID=A0A0S2KCJ7_9GAMM|nr:single-stranded-DNA-specific exonuclease RecJ [Pseudohongiella spirulinae]ALO45909.1 Single-stranded-DNA-specific exonuclease RecJ [Pseudohongiella spirulinae]